MAGMGRPKVHDDPFFQDLFARYLPDFLRTARDIQEAVAAQVIVAQSAGRVVPLTGLNIAAAGKYRSLEQEFARLIAEVMGLGDLTARGEVLKVFREAARRIGMPDVARRVLPDTARVPDVPGTVPLTRFDEAVADVVRRRPILASELPNYLAGTDEPVYRAVQRVYQEGRGFALAKAAAETAADEITKRVQEHVAEVLSGKQKFGELAELLSRERLVADLEPWTHAYSQNVLRTNLNTAVTAGQFSQAQHPLVRFVNPAFRYSAVKDTRTRENHRRLDGLVASVTDPIWSWCGTPNGYMCRCSLDDVDRLTLKRAGLLDDSGRVTVATLDGRPVDRMALQGMGAGPDEGFDKSPLQTIYLGGVMA